MSGVLSLVRLPFAGVVTTSGVGAVESMIKLVVVGAEMFPAASVAVAVMV